MSLTYNRNKGSLDLKPQPQKLRISRLLVIGGVGAGLFWLLTQQLGPQDPLVSLNNAETTSVLEVSPSVIATSAPHISRTVTPAFTETHPSASLASTASPIQSQTAALPQVSEPAQHIPALVSLVALFKGVQELTPERVGEMTRLLKELHKQGAAAVPAIRDFLRARGDINFDQLKGSELAPTHTLRQALFETLRQIGSPEAIAALAEQLQGNREPAEIAMLARNLEKVAPGVYRDQAVRVASDALQLLAPVKQADVRPLFEMMRDFGGEDVSTILAQFPVNANSLQYLRNKNVTNIPPTVRTYALMALANLPDGSGVQTLEALAGDLNVPVANKTVEPFQLLAQASVNFTDAGKALLDLAREKQIPDQAWSAVADALTGKHLQFPSQLSGGMLPGQTEAEVAGVEAPFRRGFYDDKHNLLYEERTVVADWSAKQVNQQIALIDDLLKVTSSPTAKQTLQQARASLQGNR